MANAVPAKRDVAHIAGRILNVLKSDHNARLRTELIQAHLLIQSIHPLDTLEKERLEALEGIMLSLKSPIEARAQAAAHLLEQLATDGSTPVSRRTPRS